MNLFSFKFQCQKCGTCCKNVPAGIPIYIKDAKQISSYLTIPLDDFLEQYCKLTIYESKMKDGISGVPVLYIKSYDGVCPFLNKNRCVIHLSKPYFCKSAPFISLLFQSEKLISYFQSRCHGYGKGKMYSVGNIKHLIKEEERLEEEDFVLYQEGFYSKLTDIFKKEGKK